jgi:hypothetical protein
MLSRVCPPCVDEKIAMPSMSDWAKLRMPFALELRKPPHSAFRIVLYTEKRPNVTSLRESLCTSVDTTITQQRILMYWHWLMTTPTPKKYAEGLTITLVVRIYVYAQCTVI